ncbi:MAG: hypothetical protein LKF69_00290 [Bacilli bacterium]|nr:hypothetical protein [Bacilli bacterium]MCH4235226.1 hypothetical protein [Bacilli bacterium]
MKKILTFLGLSTFCVCLVSCSTVVDVYNLQEAFNQNVISLNELQSIHYYHEDDSMPVYPETLTDEIEDKMKTSFLEIFEFSATKDDINLSYYGKYNGSYVALVFFPDLGDLNVEGYETIADIEFHYASNKRIFLWTGL